MLLRSVGRVLRIIHVAEEKVGEVEEAAPITGQSPDSLLVVQLAEESQPPPLLLDLVLGQRGRRMRLGLLGAPIEQDETC